MVKEMPSELEFKLLTLVVVERSGRDIARLYKTTFGKSISYGTLYTTFRRLREETRWVRYRDQGSEDARVRFIKLTGAGAEALNRARQHYRELANLGSGVPSRA